MLIIKIIVLILVWLVSTPIIALMCGYVFGGVSGHAKYSLSDIVLFAIVITLVYVGFPVWLFI